MQPISEQIRNMAVDGKVKLSDALRIADAIDKEREETQVVLKRCLKETGMILGEQINIHLASMKGTRFSSLDYFYDKPTGEQ